MALNQQPGPGGAQPPGGAGAGGQQQAPQPQPQPGHSPWFYGLVGTGIVVGALALGYGIYNWATGTPERRAVLSYVDDQGKRREAGVYGTRWTVMTVNPEYKLVLKNNQIRDTDTLMETCYDANGNTFCDKNEPVLPIKLARQNAEDVHDIRHALRELLNTGWRPAVELRPDFPREPAKDINRPGDYSGFPVIVNFDAQGKLSHVEVKDQHFLNWVTGEKDKVEVKPGETTYVKEYSVGKNRGKPPVLLPKPSRDFDPNAPVPYKR